MKNILSATCQILVLVCGLQSGWWSGLLADEPDPPRVDLKGKVIDEEGKGVSGAMVLIHSAGPKTGTSTFCPTCYPDCRKRATSGEDGAFSIPGLDPTLKFRVLTVGKGFEPVLQKDVDPAKRKLSVVVVPRDPEALKDTNRIAGQLFGPAGKPLAGAVVTVESVETAGGSTRFGNAGKDVDETIVSDDRGLFVAMVYGKNVVRVGGRLEAPGVAPRWISLKPGKDHVIRVGEGVKVKGRLISEGKGVAGVVMGMSSKDRSSGQGFHDLYAKTDGNGEFLFENIPPHHGFQLYSKMGDLKDRGSVQTRTVETLGEASTSEVGDLVVGKAFSIRGRIWMPDDEKIPPKTRVHFGREDAWDYQQLNVEEDGRFEVKGIPPESISMSFRIRGFRLSKKNPSLDWLNGQILGRVDRDIPDFKILVERGDWDYNNREDPPGGVEQYPRDVPLRSAP